MQCLMHGWKDRCFISFCGFVLVSHRANYGILISRTKLTAPLCVLATYESHFLVPRYDIFERLQRFGQNSLSKAR
ncbi:hypothetical protein K2173_018695 [Erythroxylum novogranatense]|uniref:Uncharacterized protein n=1 Tax=Erythroxylum novogranatense TaxID=1862640 RepID=A0AAV8SB20_9ROSI|nr:hypothetical protein K2173_018695 [Erythroxylum novogranatense]